jgi:tRNA-dihydrouridine synthase B
MRIGPYELSSNLFLSPLAGYTNLPFRLTVREIGGVDWTTTDLVNARSLLEKQQARPTAGRHLPGREDRLAIQLFGSRAGGDARRRRDGRGDGHRSPWTSTWAAR